MKIYTVSNQKGGVGKTTTALAVANILKYRGYKVLYIDADPQCNSTDTYKANTYIMDWKLKGLPADCNSNVLTLYNVLFEDVDINEAIQHTEIGDIVAGDARLFGADKDLAGSFSGEYLLAEALENLTGYDYVIMDTGPAMGKLLEGALIACNEVIIVTGPGRYELQGLSALELNILKIKKRKNPNLKIAGILVNVCESRFVLSQMIYKSFEKEAQRIGTVMLPPIRRCIKLGEAQAVNQGIMEYSPKCNGAIDYNKVVDVLIGEKRA